MTRYDPHPQAHDDARSTPSGFTTGPSAAQNGSGVPEGGGGLRGALEALADGFADTWAQRRADADREPPGTTQQHVDVAAGQAWWVAERNLRAILAAHPADAPAGPEPDPFLAEIRAAVDAADRDAPQRCGHSSEPMCCPFENFPTLAAWFRQATADAPAEVPTRSRRGPGERGA